jgi:hypothetical protein
VPARRNPPASQNDKTNPTLAGKQRDLSGAIIPTPSALRQDGRQLSAQEMQARDAKRYRNTPFGE